MDINNAIATMEFAAIAAGHMLLEAQPQSARLASDKDFLTDTDLKAEQIILRTLSSEYPDIPKLSEEAGGEDRSDGLLWIVDPIDGTINFFRQDDNWGVSIALAENGRTVAAFVYIPAKKFLYSAMRNGNARFRKEVEGAGWSDVRVNQEGDLSSSQFWVGWGKEDHQGMDHQGVYGLIAKLDQHTLYPQIRNSAVADLMMVARGSVTGYILLKPEPWDIAAAAFIVERAGGAVTDAEGNSWSPFSKSLVASNGVLHGDLLDLIKA